MKTDKTKKHLPDTELKATKKTTTFEKQQYDNPDVRQNYPDVHAAIDRIDRIYHRTHFYPLSPHTTVRKAQPPHIDLADVIEELTEKTFQYALTPLEHHCKQVLQWMKRHPDKQIADSATQMESETDSEVILSYVTDIAIEIAARDAKEIIGPKNLKNFTDEDQFRQHLKTHVLPDYPPAIWPLIYHKARYRYTDLALGAVKGIDWNTDDQLENPQPEKKRHPLQVEPDYSWPKKNFTIPGRPRIATITSNPIITDKEGAIIFLELYHEQHLQLPLRHDIPSKPTVPVLLTIAKKDIDETIKLYRLNTEALQQAGGIAGMNAGIPSVNIVPIPTNQKAPGYDNHIAELIIVRCPWCQRPALTMTIKPKDHDENTLGLYTYQLHLQGIFNGRTNLLIDPAIIILHTTELEFEINSGIATAIPDDTLDAIMKRLPRDPFASNLCMVETENYVTALKHKMAQTSVPSALDAGQSYKNLCEQIDSNSLAFHENNNPIPNPFLKLGNTTHNTKTTTSVKPRRRKRPNTPKHQ